MNSISYSKLEHTTKAISMYPFLSRTIHFPPHLFASSSHMGLMPLLKRWKSECEESSPGRTRCPYIRQNCSTEANLQYIRLYSRLAETPKCWSLEFQLDATFTDIFGHFFRVRQIMYLYLQTILSYD